MTPPQEHEPELDDDFDEEEDPQPGDTVIDFSTDPPSVWTVPDPESGPEETDAADDPIDG